MSTIKITQLPLIEHLNTNTSNTVFVAVDSQAGITGKFTATTLAAGLFANNVLNVGNNAVTLPNTVAQFALKGESYVQTNFINTSDGGTADHVITANTGTDSTYFIDFGYANKNYTPGSEFNNIGTAIEPLSGYLYVQGNTGTTLGGNLIIGTTSSNTETRFIAGGGSAANVIAKITQAGLKLVNGRTLTFDDGTVQNTAAATIVYTSAVNTTQNTNIQSAWTKANNALANTSGTFGGDLNVAGTLNVNNILTVTTTDPASSPSITSITTQNYNLILQSGSNPLNNWIFGGAGTLKFPDGTTQNTAFTGVGIDQTARNKANSALANTSGTFGGDLTITGNVVTTGTIDFNNTTFDPNTALVQITAAPTAYPASNSNYLLQITGKANTVTRVVMDSFGQNTYPVLVGRMGRGSSAAPAAVANNDVLMRIVGNGFTGTQFSPSSPTKIDFVAAETFTDTSKGTRIEFWNTPIGSNTIQKIASFNADSVSFTGAVSPQKGFIYTPNILPSSQTAITIDFANSSVVRAQTATGLTVTLSNLVAGKVVESWITNTAGTNQTFTHGISATNSTVNATSYNIPGTSTIFVKYWSMDGTLSNTFCSIVHA